jgi:hypothetical protein
VTSVFTEWIFLARTQKTLLWNIHFNICQVVYLLGHKKNYSPQPELNNRTKVSYKRCRSTEEETKREKPNTPKKVNTGSAKLPLPAGTRLYDKRKVNISSSKSVLRKRQNLHQSM